MSKFSRKHRKEYAKGFKWGRREHKAEERTTKLLIIGFIALAIYIAASIYTPNLELIWIVYAATAVFLLALVFRLVAAFAHKREKHYMDKLRFRGLRKK
jgi:uncharacterized membrane protein HdeD (DUF308 family)